MAAAVIPVAVGVATEPPLSSSMAAGNLFQRLGEFLTRLAVSVFSSQPPSHRQCAIEEALDYALEQATGIPPLKGRPATLEDARLAVKASHCHCGPVAHLLAQGISGVRFHSLDGHYVLLDGRTGLLHDLEAPRGCRWREALPLWQRERDLAQSIKATADVFERYAVAWLDQRMSRSP